MLDDLLRQVKQAIFNNPHTPHQEGRDPGGLISQIESLFGGRQRDMERGGLDNVRPASQDPYGDPADGPYGTNSYGAQTSGAFGNVRPSSEDPLGDPADGEYGRVRPASEDPLGDPADHDEEWRRRRAG